MKPTFCRWALPLVLAPLLFSVSCKKNDHSVNIFSIQDDISLGQQLRDEILANPTQYPILSKTQYPGVYAYLDNIKSKILASDQLNYKTEFAWELYVIHDDNTLNAFCAPGGYIFVYTGLMKYLNAEDQLAGVLGHEMAHADRRHSTDQLTVAYGTQLLLDILLGQNQGTLTQIAGTLGTLAFSRDQEKQADTYSVEYLCSTDYEADAAADFFIRLQTDGEDCTTGAFFSTHPCPENRIQNIQSKKAELGCTGTQTYTPQYQALINMLP